MLNLSDGEIITSGTFEITVNAVNDPPVAENQSVVLNEDESVTIYVYGNDEDSQGLSFTIIDEPENGILTSQREFATYVYNPNSNFYGTDSFTFRVSDGEFSSEGIVDLTINGVNDAPVAYNEFIELNENTSAPVYYLTEDIDGDDLSTVIISSPNYGSLDGDVYTPNTGFSGTDLFVYQVFDGELYSNQATVEFNVLDVNDPPFAINQTLFVDEDNATTFSLLGSDPDGDDITFSMIGDPENGSAQYISGLIVYTPNNNFFGQDYITFVSNDGEYDSEPGTVTINVVGTNDAPTASDFEFSQVDTFDFSTGVNDPDGDVLILTSIPPVEKMVHLKH